MTDVTTDGTLYDCQVCNSVGHSANELTWYFPGAEIRLPADGESKAAWYCSECIAKRSFHEDKIGPRLDIAIYDHEQNLI